MSTWLPHIRIPEPVEVWVSTHPRRGDHIRVSRGIYNHHGIYVSDEEVIHFTGTDDDNVWDWSGNEVIQTDLPRFLQDGILEVKEYTEEELKDLYPVDHIVHYARGSLGETNYNLIINNCEHFANMCTLGRFRSRQVERFFSIILGGGGLPTTTNGGLKTVGLFGRLADAWNALTGKSGSNGSRSSTATTNTYTYEPDRVRVAEIEADVKLKLADKEHERIELMKNAQLDLLEFECKSRIALEEAKARGLTYMAQAIVATQERLTEIAEKRLAIIEMGSMHIIQEIEGFYQKLGDKLRADEDTYNTEKLPQLLSLLEGYEKGSPSHDLFRRRIEDDMMLQTKHYTMQLESISKRQDQIMEGLFRSKDRIIEQTAQITAGLLDKAVSQNQLQEPGSPEGGHLKLSNPSPKLLE